MDESQQQNNRFEQWVNNHYETLDLKTKEIEEESDKLKRKQKHFEQMKRQLEKERAELNTQQELFIQIKKQHDNLFLQNPPYTNNNHNVSGFMDGEFTIHCINNNTTNTSYSLTNFGRHTKHRCDNVGELSGELTHFTKEYSEIAHRLLTIDTDFISKYNVLLDIYKRHNHTNSYTHNVHTRKEQDVDDLYEYGDPPPYNHER